MADICRLALLGLAWSVVANHCVAQDNNGKAIDYVLDPQQCAGCHTDKARMVYKDFVTSQPAEVWSRRDKHSQAFNLLKDQSRQLTNRILGFDLQLAFSDPQMETFSTAAEHTEHVATVRQCLKCHATTLAAKDALSGVPSQETDEQAQSPVSLSLGVTCEACHGPGKQWYDLHSIPYWRLVPRDEKLKLGLRDLRDPVLKAELCSSCHVGNLAQGKFVKHEWYAAGHPPLPSFELSSFAEQMPGHWVPLSLKGDFQGRTKDSPAIDTKASKPKYIAEVGDILADSFEAANFSPDRGSNPFSQLPRFQEALIGGVVSFKSHVGLLTAINDHADGDATPFPDFSYFDCMSCHHELKTSATGVSRPIRAGRAGRPPLPLWPTMLLRAAVAHRAMSQNKDVTEEVATFEKLLRDLELAMTRRPFGVLPEIATTSKAMEAYLTELAKDLRETDFNPASAGVALNLLSSKDIETRDYNAARHLAWALDAIGKDFKGVKYEPFNDNASPFGPVADIFHAKEPQYDANADYLHLKLPATQENFIVQDLPAALKFGANFKPDQFQADLKSVRELFSNAAAP